MKKELKQEEIDNKVAEFMRDWSRWSKSKRNGKDCPIRWLHEADREYYCKRIALYERIIDSLQSGKCDDVNFASQKKLIIFKDFEDLYRKSHNLIVKEDLRIYKTIKR